MDYPNPDLQDMPRRRRAVSEAALLSREAMLFVRPINARIGAWQAESVRLIANLERSRRSGEEDAAVVAALTRLLAHLEAQTAAFEASVAEASSGVGAHSRIADTRRGLAMVAERIRGAF